MHPPAEHPAGRGLHVTVQVSRSRMRTFVQVLGGALLGLAVATAAGLEADLVLVAYTVGLGALLLVLGLLLPEEPDADRPVGPTSPSR